MTGLAAPGARVRAELTRVAAEAEAEGLARVVVRGQLIRPLLALAAAGEDPPAGFWEGALAVQLAHEASLVHDDIVDGAATRRGEPTLAASRGVAAALVHGDHLLTSAYRLAAGTGSLEFAALFARAVERTVAGELAQARGTGQALRWDQYREIALGKAGELLGCALALAPALRHDPRTTEIYEVGRQVGLLYQMLDDLLDYCPDADTGKPPLGDYAQGRWTWPLLELPEVGFGRDPREVARRLRAADSEGGSALRRCLARVEQEAAGVVAGARGALGDAPVLEALVAEWLQRARDAVRREERASAHEARLPSRASAVLRERAPAEADVVGYLAVNSRSFRFAARFFPREELERVARVYSFCRVTDDLVDRPEGEDAEALLLEWIALAQRAYGGQPSGIAFLDRTMEEMAERGVPFRYAAELAEGMRMDLHGERYDTLPQLRTYTYRVASVVGLWLTELSGVRDPRVLEHAAALGHAMQLTNILRDVGEDARGGRIYLPADVMQRHGVTEEALRAMCQGASITPEYQALVEEMLQVAEQDYRFAFRAIPRLPRGFQRPVAVAAHVYRGIHAQIRRAGYDNLRRRAVTSTGAKALLAGRALWELRGTQRAAAPARDAEALPVTGLGRSG